MGCLMALPVYAAEGGGETRDGLPQLDTTFYPSQLFWLAITFVILYLLMARVALPKVNRTLSKRREVIEADIAAAADANKKANALLEEYEKALREARQKAQSTLNSMMEQAKSEAALSLSAHQKELNQRLGIAEAKILASKTEAIQNLESVSRELSSLIVDQVSGTKSRTA